MKLEEIEKCHCGMLISECSYPDCFTVHNHSVTGHPTLSTREHHRIERHFRQDALTFWVERATDNALEAIMNYLQAYCERPDIEYCDELAKSSILKYVFRTHNNPFIARICSSCRSRMDSSIASLNVRLILSNTSCTHPNGQKCSKTRQNTNYNTQ